MRRSEEQQLGITNFINDRLKVHRSEGWILIEKTGPHSGQVVLDTETFLRQWLKNKLDLFLTEEKTGITQKWKSIPSLNSKRVVE